MNNSNSAQSVGHVAAMREASPYIRAHRGKTFLVYFGGEALTAPGFNGLIQDLILLRGLGIKLVVVHGARPQIEQAVANANIEQAFVRDLRVTDDRTLVSVKEAVSSVRIELESRLSQAALDVPNRGGAPTVSGGNFVIARPAGVVNGVDLHFTGEVRRIDRKAIERRLDGGEIVLVSPLGYSPTGEVFNLNALDLATAVAGELGAAKLILMLEPQGIRNEEGTLIRELTVQEARAYEPQDLGARHVLECAIRACQFGVDRVHLVDRNRDGVLLDELFTRDGVGTLVSSTPFDQLRVATIDDVGGILALIEPLEEGGMLVKRSREKLETEIDRFSVLVRDGAVLACGALYPYSDQMGEIACIAVHPQYRRDGFGNIVLQTLERRAQAAGLDRVFVLTTQATEWFRESGYEKAELSVLPVERQALYNFQRNSVVLLKRP